MTYGAMHLEFRAYRNIQDAQHSDEETSVKLAMLGGIVLTLAAIGANGQQVDCPRRNAPNPASPPGMPPTSMPVVHFPKVWGGKMGIEGPALLPASEDLNEAEEGHVTAVAKTVDFARANPPPDDVIRGIVDLQKTVLSNWRFEGYMLGDQRHKVTRVFSRSGSVLVLEEWNFAADGGNVFPTREPSAKVGRFPARRGGIRAPSGCVAADLNWQGDGSYFDLRVVGPLSLEKQRELLMTVAQSIAAASLQPNQ
jgi:hypothetical protein